MAERGVNGWERVTPKGGDAWDALVEQIGFYPACLVAPQREARAQWVVGKQEKGELGQTVCRCTHAC